MAWFSSRPPGRRSEWRFLKYSWQALQPDVLEHADRADGVVRPVVTSRLVLQADLDQVAQAHIGGPLLGQVAGAGRS